jgi:hypothetical protein
MFVLDIHFNDKENRLEYPPKFIEIYKNENRMIIITNEKNESFLNKLHELEKVDDNGFSFIDLQIYQYESIKPFPCIEIKNNLDDVTFVISIDFIVHNIPKIWLEEVEKNVQGMYINNSGYNIICWGEREKLKILSLNLFVKSININSLEYQMVHLNKISIFDDQWKGNISIYFAFNSLSEFQKQLLFDFFNQLDCENVEIKMFINFDSPKKGTQRLSQYAINKIKNCSWFYSVRFHSSNL